MPSSFRGEVLFSVDHVGKTALITTHFQIVEEQPS
jgi:hypothetical protein